MTRYILLLVCCIMFSGLAGCATDSKSKVPNKFTVEVNADDQNFIERQVYFMDEIIKIHGTIKDIHVSLEKLYPITVINNGYFFVFDINETADKYEFKLKAETPMPISGEILAAFALDFYDMKPSAVISKNILEDQSNYIFIFHEFVHCFQLENGEIDIRKELLIERQEMAKNNFSWELNFPFPFNSEYFINNTIELSGFFAIGDYQNIVNYYKNMKTYLQETEFEYMIWQKWKEGFARYIENLIRDRLGLQMNTNVLMPPFGRGHFYQIGSKYIEVLIGNDKTLENNIVELFNRMKQ